MRTHLGSILLTPLIAVATCGAVATPAYAQTRRALLIGIDKYVPAAPAVRPRPRPAAAADTSSSRGRPRGVWSNLEGAVNDVEELQQVLITRYGFQPPDIHVLRNAQATRARILSETRAWLIDAASAGDVSLFFYAGHGSQVANSRSEEADKLDESIVPADANIGALDVRDKELAAVFNAAIDKKVFLTTIFDSCHSGSIGRGAPRVTRFRFIQPDDRDVADPSRPAPPESRGALVISAAQDYQLAAETEDDQKRPHGLFSWALLKTLRSMPANQSVDRVFLQVRALMQSGDAMQEPVLATTAERRRAPLFGTATAGTGSVVVAVQRVEADGSVIFQGGIAAGIRKNTELQRVGDNDPRAVRLRVTEDQGLASSRAVATDGGTTKGIEPGMLFQVVRWSAPAGPALRVSIGTTTMSAIELRREAARLSAFGAASGLSVVDDPTTAKTGTNLLQWNGSGWEIVSQGGAPRPVGRQPTPSVVIPLIANTPAGTRLTVNLPLAAEAAAGLRLGAGTENDGVEVVSSPEHADYLLIGRSRGSTIEYTWVRPLVTADQTQTSALPARTDWVALSDDAPRVLAGRLQDFAVRLAAIRGWLQLEPPADPGRFPYHLAIKNTATGEIRTTGPTRDGDKYDLILMLDDAMAREVFERRFVYVFVIDSAGRAQLLFPRGGTGAVENRLPLGLAENGALPKEIRLDRFGVSAPFGVDTFMMLTSATQLPDPTVLEGEAVRGRVEGMRGPADPLTRLLAQKRSGSRGADASTPANWAFERLTIQSVPATKHIQ